MLSRLNKYHFLVLAVCMFIIAAIMENRLLDKHPEYSLVSDFQEKLLENEEKMLDYLVKVKNEISEDSELDFNSINFGKNSVLELEGYGFLVYYKGELVYWTNSSMAFYDYLKDYDSREGLIELPNGYYLAGSVVKGDFELLGLHLVKNGYRYENKYLQNTFFGDYKLPEEFDFQPAENVRDEKFLIKTKNGQVRYGVVPAGEYHCNTGQLYWPGFIYLFALLILLFYIRREFRESGATIPLKLLGLATVLFILYWLHLLFSVPKVFLYLPFFSPEYYAMSTWLPSLGDFFILSIFFFFWLYNFGVSLNISQLQGSLGIPGRLVAVLLLLFSGSLFLLVNYFVERLILNSTISFSLNQIIEISGQSAFAIFSIGILLLAVLYFLLRIIEEVRTEFRFIQLAAVTIFVALFLAVVQYIAIRTVNVEVLLFFTAVSLLGGLLSIKYLHKFTLSYLILFVSLASIYSLFIFYNTINDKEREIQKLFAVTLVAERDLAGEEFLVDIQRRMNNDHAIVSLLAQQEELQNYEDVVDYIEKAYFSSYFRKYHLQINFCDSADYLIVQPDDRMEPCNEFMEELIQMEGDSIPGSDFYFMDNMNGRISYTGRLEVALPPDSSKMTMYIDLDSDLLFEGIGFPELLIEKSKMRSEQYQKFDYAKYYGGELTDKYGEYNYNFHVDSYLNPGDVEKEFIYKKWHNLEHLIYHTRENNFVIVSRKGFTVVDYLISFPYLFVFYFLSVLVILIFGSKTLRSRKIVIDMKFRIQAAIIFIVFLSLLGVAWATIYYNVEEYKSRHANDLNEKMKSIAEEIDMRLEDKVEITDSLENWLHRELNKLSNIFRTDINIYGTNGTIIASSREEIFLNGLTSSRMNAKAYNEIYQNFSADYTEIEDIGKLTYLSAYKPIINNYSDYLGVINLPYFIKQDNYSQEITTLIVAFINLYVLLFLVSIISAVFIANQITRPLVVIQENLKKIELGKHNDPIHYNRDDEIGSLVREYNKKVDELAVSADLLARSERESAWREMAKQIAHEIKNPLTPMKLNIQYLQRTRGKDEEYNKYMERVTGTLIEQIDNLSNIATEFSNFAKIPTARNQVFRLTEQLQKVIDLYETHDQAEIIFKANDCGHIRVNADREQLSRAVINLIRNGIQSIPTEKNGKIEISVENRDDKALISVTDNGTGIPPEMRDKLFSPSFTTKTSGMGLGLAIVKNIVENFAGKIWFETEMDKGTAFFLEIPVFKEEQV